MTATQPPSRAKGVPGPIRVLLAEDEAIIRLDLAETLTEEGYEIVADTGNGDEAVALAERLAPDVAILDIKMPGLDGLSAARRITALGTTAVLVLTAFSQRDLVAEAADAGALGFLVKPFQRHELVPAVEIALARHREHRAVAAEASRLGDQLATRKLLDRAKGKLMDDHGMTESAAFGFVQRAAMSQRRTIAAVAADVLSGAISAEESPPHAPG